MGVRPVLLVLFSALAMQVNADRDRDDDRNDDRDRFLPFVCLARRFQFSCDHPRDRWFYDREDHKCRRFEGCVGSGNNFPDERSCEALCENQRDPCRDVRCNNCEECRRGFCVAKPNCFRDSCRFIRCGPCEECNNGFCLSVPGCVPIPPPDACQFVRCGPCERCQNGFCESIPGCIPIPPDPCRLVQCGPCQTCSNGQCFEIIGCIPPRICQFPQQCGPCSFCNGGFCQPVPGCVGPPAVNCFLFPCPPCFQCFANQCIPIPGCPNFDPCKGVRCGRCGFCSRGRCIRRPRCFFDWFRRHD